MKTPSDSLVLFVAYACQALATLIGKPQATAVARRLWIDAAARNLDACDLLAGAWMHLAEGRSLGGVRTAAREAAGARQRQAATFSVVAANMADGGDSLAIAPDDIVGDLIAEEEMAVVRNLLDSREQLAAGRNDDAVKLGRFILSFGLPKIPIKMRFLVPMVESGWRSDGIEFAANLAAHSPEVCSVMRYRQYWLLLTDYWRLVDNQEYAGQCEKKALEYNVA